MNKFEQVSSDDNLMLPAGGGYVQEGVGMSRGEGGYVQGGGGYPYHVIYPLMHVMLPNTPRPQRHMPVKTLPSRNYCCGR